MSIRVMNQVFTRSEEKLGRRLVQLCLADAASEDGVSWPQQEEIGRKARLSVKHVNEILGAMVADGVVEVRKAQVGRRRINVYRLVLPGLDEPNYERLPFKLAEPFTTPDIPVPLIGDDPGSSGLTTPEVPPLRAREPYEPSKEPSKGTPSGVPAVRPRNLVYDALAEACGIRPELLSSKSPIFDKDLAREIGNAQGKIREKSQGLPDAALADEVRLRARAYVARWPEIELTPHALAKHWNRVVDGVARRKGMTPEEIIEFAAGLE